MLTSILITYANAGTACVNGSIHSQLMKHASLLVDNETAIGEVQRMYFQDMHITNNTSGRKVIEETARCAKQYFGDVACNVPFHIDDNSFDINILSSYLTASERAMRSIRTRSDLLEFIHELPI